VATNVMTPRTAMALWEDQTPVIFAPMGLMEKDHTAVHVIRAKHAITIVTATRTLAVYAPTGNLEKDHTAMNGTKGTKHQ
jgi:hypothetical protein